MQDARSASALPVNKHIPLSCRCDDAAPVAGLQPALAARPPTLHGRPMERPEPPQAGLSRDAIEQARRAEARRILGSVDDEMQAGGLGGAVKDRFGTTIAGHFSARDADPADRIEVIGRRIGRGLSLILCIGLIVYLARMLAAG
jgi:hypothetical protein